MCEVLPVFSFYSGRARKDARDQQFSGTASSGTAAWSAQALVGEPGSRDLDHVAGLRDLQFLPEVW